MPGSTRLIPIDLPSGFNRNETPYGAEGYYVSGNNVRFRYGKPEVMGGREPVILPRPIQGVARESHAWRDLEDEQYMGFGTNEKLEIIAGGSVYDVTPIRVTTTIVDGLTVTSGSSVMVVSDAGHNANATDFVNFSSATVSLGGISINGSEYAVVTVYSPSSYGVETNTAATASFSSAGGSVTINYLYPTGLVDNGTSFGYGAGSYGTYGASTTDGYGDPRGGSVGTKLRLWSLDNWGEDLVACPQGGKIYCWYTSTGPTTRAVEVTAAPSINTFILVAQPQRQLVTFGTHGLTGIFDPNLVRWSASEDFNDWTASVGNNAGSFRVNSRSGIVGAVNTRGTILIITGDTAVTMTYTGDDLIYEFKDLGSKTDLVSQGAITDVNGTAYWMGSHNFYKFDGIVQVLPCSVHQYIFNPEFDGYLNQSQKEKVVCGVNTDFDEIIWFFPDKSNMENNRYVIYNYVEEVFYDGLIERTTWLDRGVFVKPQAVDSSGNLWTHEQGYNDGGASLEKSIETSEFDLSDGQNLMFVDRFIPDFEVEQSLTMEFSTRKYPNGPLTEKGPYTITADTQQIKFRARGRQASIRFSTAATDGFFRLGKPRIGVQENGER